MNLEALRLAEEFFARKPEALPSARAFLLGALERWPETEIVTQKSQVGLRDPRPYCALTAPGARVRGRPVPGALLSLFLPRPLETETLLLAVEAYPGRFTNHLVLPENPADFDGDLWSWTEEARRFRCGKMESRRCKTGQNGL
ncbi:hypothetical protein [uncultured Oscillibacter sp.]|uniref:hypothetical protein n=1 Tax=uncultured Oscillibacter sp. TaxID=876091 RepID=UPI0025F0A2E9|nr:hypothetical protein [uncultured Oscillibacter sp.]